jgi:very-short-patch-repair endonuclease/transcription elongation GreA/GreB family factor
MVAFVAVARSDSNWTRSTFLARGPRERLIGLLDYVEQVVRLDESVAFRVSDYRLADGTSFAIRPSDTTNLPGIQLDVQEEEGPVWLAVSRLARREPPSPPPEIAEWILVSTDPARLPEPRLRRATNGMVLERPAATSADARSDHMIAVRRREEMREANVCLEGHPAIASAIQSWISGPWAAWATEEMPRRRTIALYQQLYKIFQMVDSGAADSPIEVIWGIGVVRWQKEGRVVDRPLLEIRVDLELDEARGGLLRIRPTCVDPTFDLRPYERLGCEQVPQLADLLRSQLQKVVDDKGVSPFVRASFEPLLSSVVSHLDAGGQYASDAMGSNGGDGAHLTVTDQWVVFARPRSQRVVLQDIDRMRRAVLNSDRPIGSVAERLVSEPSNTAQANTWAPDHGIVLPARNIVDPEADNDRFEVLFPKPFNDDQIEIIRRLKSADGLVVQGPPGTGKTHTIANLICHVMATGGRVLVVSRSESALAVLKDQLPQEVQPLAIALLSNERQGLRQLESAIGEIQAVVEGTLPENRHSAIRRMEVEIDGLRQRIKAIDDELDSIAMAHLSNIGPRGETPAELARRAVTEPETFAWFTDRPTVFAAQVGFSTEDVAALGDARRRIGDLLDHLESDLPSSAQLPAPEIIRSWHDDVVRASQLRETANTGPVRVLRVTSEGVEKALKLADTLQSLAATHPATLGATWLETIRRAAVKGETGSWWLGLLRERLREWAALEAESVRLARRSVELPPGISEDDQARKAIFRAAKGERLWPVFSMGKGATKTLLNAIRVDGVALREGDVDGWRHVAGMLAHTARLKKVTARWHTLAAEIGAPTALSPTISVARSILAAADDACAQAGFLSTVVAESIGLDALADDPDLCRSLADQIRTAASAVRLAAVHENIRQTLVPFQNGSDRTSGAVRQFFEQVLGSRVIPGDKIEAVWWSACQRIADIRGRAPDFATIHRVTDLIAKAGAPQWARNLRTQPASDNDPWLPNSWREAWDHAAIDAKLASIDARARLVALAQERGEADDRCAKLLAQLVRERTFYELDRRLSPAVKSALVEFVRALAKIGKGMGKTAGVYGRSAREAMARCYDAVPCWIMPTWRVVEQFPPELGAIDLVIIDEASQSDVTELPALLRGRKLLVVGDDRQVSPTPPFVTHTKISQLRQNYLGDLPFKSLLEPGESIYDLMRAVFPNERLMLKEHFRCVEPIVRFSMQFYPEKLMPLRIPTAQDRLDPPLVDIYVPHGSRDKHQKINRAEADVIVEEIKALTTQPSMRKRSIGVISLIGAQQAEYIRTKLSESIGEELMQSHGILCGDSATFQGTERDVVFLSMVADPVHQTALTMRRYEQRFNVAVSRGRDRVVLVRSVRREELNPGDLKARLIAHFENPMPPEVQVARAGLEACETYFEQDLMRRLVDRGYWVQAHVGPLGFAIDLVVEGSEGRRLAIECDGDRFHGREQWREDMRRQRVLERVGWRFWRCFASSFYRDRDGVAADLFNTLSNMGIEPQLRSLGSPVMRWTEHRVVELGARDGASEATSERARPPERLDSLPPARDGIVIGDKIVVLFADDQCRMSLRLTEATHDIENGLLSSESSLGRAIKDAEEGDEIEFQQDDGRQRKALIESVEKDVAISRLSGDPRHEAITAAARTVH